MEFYNLISEEYINITKQAIIYPIFKVCLLDEHENIVSEITRDISSENSGSININYQQGVRRSCSLTFIDPLGEFIPNERKGVFWIGQKFKLYVGLKNQSNNNKFWFSQGVFYVNDPNASRDFSNKTVTISGVDKFGILGSELGYNQLEGTYLISRNTKIYKAIQDILKLQKGNNRIIDVKNPVLDIDMVNEVLPYDINKSPGSYLSDILIEMGNILGSDIYYNSDGQLTLIKGTDDFTYKTKSAIYDFSDSSPNYISPNLKYDYPSVINIQKVVGSNINGSVVEYTAENNNPLSPTRIELIGKKVGEIYETNNISTTQRAMECAKYLLNKKSIVQMAMSFSCPLLPHLDVDSIISITDSYLGYEKERFIIQSISMPLNSNSLMSISCSNVASLPYYEK